GHIHCALSTYPSHSPFSSIKTIPFLLYNIFETKGTPIRQKFWLPGTFGSTACSALPSTTPVLMRE
ncbi:hypothetical protein, partial [Heyndrickxia faecalis]|uniref:hypothetical protein n=1 Tax=Heyndrickxia faecalis TaxID=2824910 RepID=UPI003D255CA1